MLTETIASEQAQASDPRHLLSDPLRDIFPMTFARLSEGEGRRLVDEFRRGFKRAARLSAERQFLEFIGAKKWSGENEFLPTLAEAEWLIHDVRGEAELPVHGLDKIPLATGYDWDHARFFFDPGHRLMDSDWNLSEIFQDLGGTHARRPGRFLVYRHQGQPKVRPVKPGEAELIEALSLGVSLGTIQDRPNGPDLDSFLFHRWIDSGFLRAIHWPAV